MLLDISIKGYEIFRDNLHLNCITGWLHAVGMPIILIGFFVFLHGYIFLVTDNIKRATDITKSIVTLLGCLFIFGYTHYDIIIGFITVNIYMWLIITSLNNKYRLYKSYIDKDTNFYNPEIYAITIYFMINGILMIIIPLFIMEFIGHWLIENNSSNVSNVINSIYWTPLYGINSLIYPFTGQCKF